MFEFPFFFQSYLSSLHPMTNTVSQIPMLQQAIEANKNRTFFAAYPEIPKAYPEEWAEAGLKSFQKMLNQNFSELTISENSEWIGGEVSPYMQTGLGIHYPALPLNSYINNAAKASEAWAKTPVLKRAEILIDSLERIKTRFYEIAYATMHTTGQSFMMSFQASGPHANDRSLEAIAMGVEELSRFPGEVNWVKPMGKFDLSIRKNFKAIPKGLSLVIGCSTFPTWNTVPGVYASLITGNPVIVKPHPKAILPIAIVVAEIQKSFIAAGLNANIIQLAPDTIENPVTKLFTEHPDVKMIDYTGGPDFGSYIESLNKTCFTEKAGVNTVILDSVKNIDAVAQNLAFSISLYSGQMCTAPQYIFVSEEGVNTPEGKIGFDDFVALLSGSIKSLVENPKAGPYTLGAIQNDQTVARAFNARKMADSVSLDHIEVIHPEFEHARMKSPSVLVANVSSIKHYTECFGPAVFVVKTNSFADSLRQAEMAAKENGAITCLAYSTDENKIAQIEEIMNKTYTPVSFNFTGAAFVNQHAAFSDFHVTGGNASGNATFTNPGFINNRFVWVGNRFA